MTDKERIAEELRVAADTLGMWQYHGDANLMTPQDLIDVIRSVLIQMADNLET